MVELMVVVAIIGIGAAVSAAGVGDAFSENRASRAARELVRIGRRARSDAMGYLRAYMVWVEPAQNRVSLVRSWSTNCATENWNARWTATGGCGGLGVDIPIASACVEQVRFTDPTFSNDAFASRIDLDVGGAPAPTAVALCYNANGGMFTDRPANLAAVNFNTLTQNNDVNLGAIRFWVRRMNGAVQQGVQRYVLFPQGAPPRLER